MGVVQIAIGSALWSASGHWWTYLAVWFLPLKNIRRHFLRAFADHARLAVDPAAPREGRLITISHQLLWERLFVAPFQFNFHAEHHLYPSIPHQYLPRLHEMIKNGDAYQRQCIVRRNYCLSFGLLAGNQLCAG